MSNDQGEFSVPRVGIGVMVFKDGKVLLGKRKNSHGEGEYAFQGGHLEHMETFEECAKREVLEETGMEIENIEFLCVVNLTKYPPKHYVDIGLVADWKSGEPKVNEKDKVESWEWYDLNELPSPLFGVCAQYVQSFRTGESYFNL